jgi:hypothetical protein
VRLAYLDEAGISKTADEPYLVVAGIILHGDDIGVRSRSISGDLGKEIKIIHHEYTDRYAEILTGINTFYSKRIIYTIDFYAKT